MLWFSQLDHIPGKPAFLYQFKIDEPFRRQGYGLAALQALEEKVEALGGTAVWLHVFGHNAPARSMYAKAGYEVMDLTMAKAVGPDQDT